MRLDGETRKGSASSDGTSERRARRRPRRRAALVAIALAALAGVIHSANAVAVDPPSTYAGTHLTAQQAAQDAYNAGFRTESSLLTVVAIGIAESGLVTQTRNWHPEFGYRPASDVIGVPGPASAWSGNQQMHSDRGAWQISSRWWPQYSDAQTDDPVTAAKIMFAISRNGTDFTPWNTYTSGAAQQYYDAAHGSWPALRPIVQQVLAGGGSAPAAAPTVAPSPTVASSTNPSPTVAPAPAGSSSQLSTSSSVTTTTTTTTAATASVVPVRSHHGGRRSRWCRTGQQVC